LYFFSYFFYRCVFYGLSFPGGYPSFIIPSIHHSINSSFINPSFHQFIIHQSIIPSFINPSFHQFIIHQSIIPSFLAKNLHISIFFRIFAPDFENKGILLTFKPLNLQTFNLSNVAWRHFFPEISA